MAGFSDPVWLLGLFLIPILAALYWLVLIKKKQEALEFSNVSLIKSALGSRPRSRRANVLVILSLAALTRLEAAKHAADLLISSLEPADNAGVVIFESGATTAAYLSPDKDRVRQKLAAVVPKPGQTSIGDGLTLAIDMARSIPNRKSVVILLSDGMNNAGTVTPDEAIAAAQAAHIQVFTVGLGSAQPVVIGYDWTGNPQYADLDETTLRSLAEKGGGRYFRSVDHTTLAEIYQGLNKEIPREVEETPVGAWFIAGALFILLIEFWLRYGRGRIIP